MNSQGADSVPAAKGSGENERINELTGNWRETQRDRDFWRDRALANEGKGKPGAAADAKANDGDGEADEVADEEIKTLADFKYDEKAYTKYIRDLGRTEAKREVDSLRSEIRDGRTQEEKAAAVREFADKATAWGKEQKLEKIENMFLAPEKGGPRVTDTMAEAIISSDHGPAVLNFLAMNLAESNRIAKLSPALQAREIGRLEGKFASAPAQSTVSAAPPPHETVKGKSDSSVTKDPAKMTDQEWWQHKQRSDNARRAATARK